MQNTKKKLLSITNLKKYFPIAKSSVFQKEKLYVKANEDVSIDIYEGETFGLVGESGCGKSTLGRVVLQLYEQTAGNTLYYGRSRAEIAPRYVKDTLSNPEKYLNLYKEAKVKAEKLAAQAEAEGENASFFLLQEKNLAEANEKSALMNVAKILGGLITVPEMKEGANILLNQHNVLVKIEKLNRKILEIEADIDIRESKLSGDSGDDKVKVADDEALKKIRALKEKTIEKVRTLREEEDRLQQQIDAIRAKYKDDEEFRKYEAMLDAGIDLARLKYNEIRRLRKDLQIIFQDPYSALDPHQNVREIMAEPISVFEKLPEKEMDERIVSLLEKVGMKADDMEKYAYEFSGGQRQRIGIARALSVHPEFLLCDEPISALDVSIQAQVVNVLEDLQQELGLTYLFVAHDLSMVRHISDRIGVMYLGKIVESGDSDEVYDNPCHPYTRALLASIPIADPKRALSLEHCGIEGDLPSPLHVPSGCRFHTRCPYATEQCRQQEPELEERTPGHMVACWKK